MVEERRPNRWLDGLALLAAAGGGYGMVRCFRDGVRQMDAPDFNGWIWAVGLLAGLTAAAGIALYWRKNWSRIYFRGLGILGGGGMLTWAIVVGSWSTTGDAVRLGLQLFSAFCLLALGLSFFSKRVGQVFEEDAEKIDE